MSNDPTPAAATRALAPAHMTSKRRRGPMVLGLSQQYPAPRHTVLSADVTLIHRLFGELSHE
jgi:hypothetical protein